MFVIEEVDSKHENYSLEETFIKILQRFALENAYKSDEWLQKYNFYIASDQEAMKT